MGLEQAKHTGTTIMGRCRAASQDHWLHGFNFNVEEWFEGDYYETLAICRSLAFARAVFKGAIAAKPADRFMIRSRSRVAQSEGAPRRLV